MKQTIHLALLCLFLAQAPLLFALGTRLLRQPSVSEKHIVFVYADDLWLVDPQLERAVQEALNLMKTKGVVLKPQPAAPIRYKRP